jgi:hypothetical protein
MLLHSRSGSAVIKQVNAMWPFSGGLAVIGFQDQQVYIDNRGRVIAPYASDKQ